MTATPAYDYNGNTTTDDQGHTLIYDAWNRLVQVKNGGTTLATYMYDANGNRVSQTEGGSTSQLYTSSAGQVLEERQSGRTINQYVWSLAYVNALVERDDSSSGGSYGESGSGLGRRLYVQQDANFDVTALTNTSGTVQERFIYSPYGVTTVIDGTTSWSTTTDMYSWVYTFQGGRASAASGMIHFGARDYSSTLGTWMQPEPFYGAYIDGANLYQAMGMNPVSHVDPTGTCDENANPQDDFLRQYQAAMRRAATRPILDLGYIPSKEGIDDTYIPKKLNELDPDKVKKVLEDLKAHGNKAVNAYDNFNRKQRIVGNKMAEAQRSAGRGSTQEFFSTVNQLNYDYYNAIKNRYDEMYPPTSQPTTKPEGPTTRPSAPPK
jgi:RHS repeat-associated protein